MMGTKKKGREVVDLLLDGEKLYISKLMTAYYIYKDSIVYFCNSNSSCSPANLSLNDFFGNEYYIESVSIESDIRDVLHKHPGKWVAKYRFLGDWVYIGVCPDTFFIVGSYDDTAPVKDIGIKPTEHDLEMAIIRPAFSKDLA